MTDHFALEGPPDDGPVAHRELCKTTSRKNKPLRDIECIHNGDNVVVAGAGALDVLDQLGGDQVVHVPPKVRGMERHTTLQVVEEEHVVRVVEQETARRRGGQSSPVDNGRLLSPAVVDRARGLTGQSEVNEVDVESLARRGARRQGLRVKLVC